MIVCHCFAVSDREVRACAEEGHDLEHVGRTLGAGTECRGCRPRVAAILDGIDAACPMPALGTRRPIVAHG